MSEELREHFNTNFKAKSCFESKISLDFWQQRLSEEGPKNWEELSPELIEFEGELALIRDFPKTKSELEELINNLALPVARHLTKRRG